MTNAGATARFRIGIDTGGTFTDIVSVDTASGAIARHQGRQHAGQSGDRRWCAASTQSSTAAGATADDVAGLAHGTTVATNALLQGEINSLGLIVTEGFRHILEIARQSVPEGYGNSYFWVKPDRIVPLRFVREVGGRLNFQRPGTAPARRGKRARRRRSSSARRASAPSASACCIPMPTPRTSAASPRSSREEYPECDAVAVLRRAAGIPRIRARGDDAGRRLRQAAHGALSRARARRARRRPAGQAVPGDAVERRRRQRRPGGAQADHHGAVRARRPARSAAP